MNEAEMFERELAEDLRDSVVEVEVDNIELFHGEHDEVHLPPPPPSLRSGSPFGVTGTPRLASDLMTRRLFTIGPSDHLEQIQEQMEAFRFRHLPIVEGGKLVGLITRSDLLHASSSFLSDPAGKPDEWIQGVPASRIMQRDVISVRASDPLDEVAVLMWEARIGCVLVTEEDGDLVGIITESDFIRLAHHFLTHPNAGPQSGRQETGRA